MYRLYQAYKSQKVEEKFRKELRMKQELLNIKDLYVNVGDKEILKGLNLKILPGEIHVIMGPNGSGKSTTANAILNHPAYTKVK